MLLWRPRRLAPCKAHGRSPLGDAGASVSKSAAKLLTAHALVQDWRARLEEPEEVTRLEKVRRENPQEQVTKPLLVVLVQGEDRVARSLRGWRELVGDTQAAESGADRVVALVLFPPWALFASCQSAEDVLARAQADAPAALTDQGLRH